MAFILPILGRNILFVALGLFAVSLTFRTLDNAVCDTLPLGTHFLWHVLNGCVLYLTTRGYLSGRGSNFQPPIPPESR
jgi:hypothetical protein